MTATAPAREVLVSLLNELMLAEFIRLPKADESASVSASFHPVFSELGSVPDWDEKRVTTSRQPSATSSLASQASVTSQSRHALAVKSWSETLALFSAPVVRAEEIPVVELGIPASTPVVRDSLAVRSWKETLSVLTGTAAPVAVTATPAPVIRTSTNPQVQSWRESLSQLAGIAATPVAVAVSVSDATVVSAPVVMTGNPQSQPWQAVLQQLGGITSVQGMTVAMVEEAKPRWQSTAVRSPVPNVDELFAAFVETA